MRCMWIGLVIWMLMSGCSREGEEESDGSAIDRATKEVADKVVEQIKTPIDKAEAVKDSEEARHDRFEEQSN